MQQNIAVPLATAGYRNITVNVSFDGDSGGALDGAQKSVVQPTRTAPAKAD